MPKKENKTKPAPAPEIKKKEIAAETKASEIEELKKILEAKDNELNQAKNRHLRALADLENYKKRVSQEKENLLFFSTSGLVVELLPILDGFERALKEAEKSASSEEIVKGIALIKKQMKDVFTKFGVSEVDALGIPFDPHFHEAVMQKESDKPEHEIIEVMQKGYTLNKKLIRPAMVIISKGGK